MRYEAETPRALRELVILRVAQLTASEYEWAHHRAMAEANGVPRREGRGARRLALRERASTSASVAALGCVDEIHAIALSDDAFAALERSVGQSAAVELVLLVSFYECVARMIQAFGLEVEPRLPAVPRPAGLAGRSGRVRYRIGVDIGGTFTDCVVADERGARTVSKAPTTPGSLQDGVLEAVAVNAEQLGLTRSELLAATDLFVHGTTQATNAMLTRTGARTGLITTKGHEDAIIIGKVYAKVAGLPERDLVALLAAAQARPDRAALADPRRHRAHRPRRRRDRRAPGGRGLAAIDEPARGRASRRSPCRCCGRSSTRATSGGSRSCWPSARTASSPRTRTRSRRCSASTSAPRTTAINAYVGPKVVGYLGGLESQLRDEGLDAAAAGDAGERRRHLGRSDAAQRPIVTLDSGPAGGILGCQYLGRLYGERT